MSDLEWVKILIRKIFRKKVLLRKKGVPPPHRKSRNFWPEFACGIVPPSCDERGQVNIGGNLHREGKGEGSPRGGHRWLLEPLLFYQGPVSRTRAIILYDIEKYSTIPRDS